jgi:hypothetical protein
MLGTLSDLLRPLVHSKQRNVFLLSFLRDWNPLKYFKEVSWDSWKKPILPVLPLTAWKTLGDSFFFSLGVNVFVQNWGVNTLPELF